MADRKNQEEKLQAEQNQKAASMLQSNLDTVTDARGIRAASAMLHETGDGSTRVANERQEDCPAIIRAGAVAGVLVFAASIIVWFLSIANFFPASVSSSTVFNTALYIVMGVSLVIGVVCCFVQWYLNRRAWIRRMRAQEEERSRHSDTRT